MEYGSVCECRFVVCDGVCIMVYGVNTELGGAYGFCITLN